MNLTNRAAAELIGIFWLNPRIRTWLFGRFIGIWLTSGDYGICNLAYLGCHLNSAVSVGLMIGALVYNFVCHDD